MKYTFHLKGSSQFPEISQLFWHGICSALEYGQEIARLVGSPSCVYQPLLKTIVFFPPTQQLTKVCGYQKTAIVSGPHLVMRNFMGVITGWWLSPTPLKNMSSSVGMIIPNIWKIVKFMFQTTNQYMILMIA